MMAQLLLAGAGFMAWWRAGAGRGQRPAPVSQPPASQSPVSPAPVSQPPEQASSAATREATLAQHEAAAERFVRRSLVLLAGTTAGALIGPIVTAVTVPFLVVHAVPLFRQGYLEIREGKLGGGVVRALAGGGMLLTRSFWVLSLSNVLYGYTDTLQIKARRRSQHRLGRVFGELPRKARVCRGDAEIDIALEDVTVGDLVVVGAGQAIPADGRIERGEASIDQKALTGEAQPTEKTVGDHVHAATVVVSGSIAIRVERAGASSVVAGIEEILTRATDHPSALERKGKVIADRAIVPTLALAALAQLVLGSDASVCTLALYPGEGIRMLGPLSRSTYVRHAAEQQILIKEGRVLESLQEIDTVVFAIEVVSRDRDEVVSLVKELQARGMAVYLLSGDHDHASERLALQLGVEHFVAGTPGQSAERITAWQAQGKHVCFVGDGNDDSLALRSADVSVSLAGASTIAADAAHVMLLDGNLERLPLLFDLAKDLAVNMRHNLMALLAPSPLLAVGIFFLGLRTPATLLLTTASGLAGLANATLVAERRLKKLERRPEMPLRPPQPMTQRTVQHMDEPDAETPPLTAHGADAAPADQPDVEAQQLALALVAAVDTVKRTVRRLLSSLDDRFGAAIEALGRAADS